MNDRALEEVFLSSQEIYRGCIINVERWRVRLPNGQEADREIVLHRGAAAMKLCQTHRANAVKSFQMRKRFRI